MKIVCIGRNYKAHADELNNAIPEEPVIFIKPDSASLLNNAPFYIPSFSNEIHHEIELFVKISKPGKAIPIQFASSYYDQIGVGIDFTARDLQNELKAKGLPWEKAKGFDNSAVIGKTFSKKEFNLSNLEFKLYKNDAMVQIGNVAQMIFSIDEIISYVSHFFSLKTGDLIFTGTPEGVSKVAVGDRLRGLIADKPGFDFTVK